MKAIIKMIEISKKFPGVLALDKVKLEVFENEIVGIVGENGAGKTTLMKILMGIYQPDGGEIFVNNEKVMIRNPASANSHGIGMVFQEQSVFSNMKIYENLFIGHEKFFSNKFGFINKVKMLKEATRILSHVSLNNSPSQYLFELDFASRQLVEIARNIWLSEICKVQTPIIILDEPTSVLEQDEISLLFEKLNKLKTEVTVIYISHRLEEIVELCDRVYVLKDGKNVSCLSKEELSEDTIRNRMVGDEFHGEYYLLSEQRAPSNKVLLSLRNCNKKGFFQDISFDLREGEIISLCGTVGSGKEELCKVISGSSILDDGDILVEGIIQKITSPNIAFNLGIGYISEDRKNESLILNLPIFENVTLPILSELKKYGLVSKKKQIDVTYKMIDKLKIKAQDAGGLCLNLSGGNQQKVVIAKWLLSNIKVLIMSHPTRGVDIGAKHEIYSFIREMARKGMAMIILGDSFDEDIGMANNILVMKDGYLKKVLDATESKPSHSDLIRYLV